jgi:hypothetical protein
MLLNTQHFPDGTRIETRSEDGRVLFYLRSADGWSRVLSHQEYADMLRQAKVRHLKLGSTYRIVGRGPLQTSGALYEGAVLVAYVSEDDGQMWFRPINEFQDGRFEWGDSTPEIGT